MGSSLADDASKWPCGLIETSVDGTVLRINDTFTKWVGRAPGELEGSSLRDLLAVGSRVFFETHVAPMVRLHGAASEIALDLVVADGTRLAALVNVATRTTGAENRLYFSVVQATQRRTYERELMQARREADAATAVAERAQDRLELLAEVNAVMSVGLELHPALERLADLIARRRDCACLIVTNGLLSPGHHTATLTSTTAIPTAISDLTDALVAGSTDALWQWPAWLRTSTGRLEERLPEWDSTAPERPQVEVGTTVVTPIRRHEAQLGAIVLVRGPEDAPFDRADLSEISTLSHRVGLQMDNMRLSAGEHDRALALQQALLTPPGQPDGVEVMATYLPNADGAMVGGDWYDSLVRPDGTSILVIGDVTGHDHVAAAAMGQLRGLLRTVAYLSVESPARVLSVVDTTADELGLDVRATAILAYLSPPDQSGRRKLQWANAGHLPPVIVAADATVHWLETKPDIMLGVSPARPRQDHHRSFHLGDTLVFYTDGLIENRTRPIDAGLHTLHKALELSAKRPVGILASDVVAALATEVQDDDIALLIARSTSTPT